MGSQQARNNIRLPRSLAILSPLSRLLFFALASLPSLWAAPTSTRRSGFVAIWEEEESPSEDRALWIYLVVAIGLVLLGGAFAGLTIALMGQDEIYLQVISTSGEGAEKRDAARVLRLLKRGKHWVLVTLLLGNVITNETLPIVLDRSLGGGWPAVLGSTVLIVIFGEIIPQSICVRYGLPIGAWMSPLVLILMYIMAPVAWPTAKLLDRLLGEDHGTVYKKAGLKTLVTLHRTMGAAGEQLNEDEVTIIGAVLDLKEKPIGSIMTPMEDVFTMSADTILDEKTMDNILSAGYSRIPIHHPDNPLNFVGMLLVKILITYDPEDCKAVREFALATLPETSPDTSCLDIVNFFQEGKSHMVLVSTNPGQDTGALGVVTLEDVIEELIGESVIPQHRLLEMLNLYREIVDESDVFVDVHKAIRRMNAVPRYRLPAKKGELISDQSGNMADDEEQLVDLSEYSKSPAREAIRRLASVDASDGRAKSRKRTELSSSPNTMFFMRRTSSVTGNPDRETISRRADNPEVREHLKHLGPSNLASRPRQTRYTTVKIKPGASNISDIGTKPVAARLRTTSLPHQPISGDGVDSLIDLGDREARDGAQALRHGYGSFDEATSPRSREGNEQARVDDATGKKAIPEEDSESDLSESTVGSLPRTSQQQSTNQNRSSARSGSITENIIETGGIRKVVLETTSSSEEGVAVIKTELAPEAADADRNNGGKSGKKKRRRKRRKDGANEENIPLLDGE